MGSVKDKFGREIEVGSIIAYGHAFGRSAGIRIGKVLKLDEFTRDYRGGLVSPTYKISVRGINDDWSHQQVELTKHAGILNYPDRIIVLSRSDLSEEYQKLLDSI